MVQGQLLKDVNLARYTTWRVGGFVEQLFKPKNLEDLRLFLSTTPEHEQITWLGLGSNVLIRDGGIKGTVIVTQGGLTTISWPDEVSVRVEAGVPCPKLAKKLAEKGLVGAEFLTGIPGTIGGALAMNAGAFGGETWDVVSQVEMVDSNGECYVFTKKDFEIGYRTVTPKFSSESKMWFVACTISLQPGDVDEAKQKIKALLKQRQNSQPIGLPSSGSVFQNPDSGYAAELIEQSGLKGKRIGHAQVSTKHANFIINTGKASSLDIENLMTHVTEEVYQSHGVALQPEVKIIGEKK